MVRKWYGVVEVESSWCGAVAEESKWYGVVAVERGWDGVVGWSIFVCVCVFVFVSDHRGGGDEATQVAI